MSYSIPATVKSGPTTTNTLGATWYILIYILLIWLSAIPEVYLMIRFISTFNTTYLAVLFYTPIQLFVWYILFTLCSLVFSKIFLSIVNLFHHPREGIFPRDRKNVDFKYWTIRAVIKKYAFWITHNFPLPWLDIIAYKWFGNRIPMKTPVFDSWMDSEFIEIGNDSTIGQGSVIMTSMITTEFLIIKRVKIGNNCLVGAHSVISPGTIINDNVIIGALSSTTIEQELESNWIYMGAPAKKYRELKFREDDELTSEERAQKKDYKELLEEFPDDAEIDGRRVIKLVSKGQKQDLKAQKLENKAQYFESKAEQKYAKQIAKADKRKAKAEKRKLEAQIAIKQARALLTAQKDIDSDLVQEIEQKIDNLNEKLSKLSLPELVGENEEISTEEKTSD